MLRSGGVRNVFTIVYVGWQVTLYDPIW